MLVYGDRSLSTEPARLLDTIGALLVESRTAEPHVTRHDSLVAALIEAGMLAQGIADAEMQAANGFDTASPLQAATMALVTALARAVQASWRSEPSYDGLQVASALADLQSRALPARIEVKQPEGFAYYALFPEAYAAAARGLPAGTRVIGIRSIGTTLAASVAAGAGCESLPVSLRPVGPPFTRHYAIDDGAWRTFVGWRPPCHALVDEGPGLSGSSLGALADRLEDAGVAPESIAMFPGHGGDVGPEAAHRHKIRWSRVERRLATFESIVLPRLAAAVEDLTGPAKAALEDLSGGRWRHVALESEADWPPVNAGQERRKFLLSTDQGAFLVKFAGLGGFGRTALRDAQAVHEAGFGPQPLGLRLGFMVLRWEKRSPKRRAPVRRADWLDRLGEYLAFRTTLPPDVESRADLTTLAAMTVHNITGGLGSREAEAWRLRYSDLERLPAASPVRTDNRLHAWEWLRAENDVLLKADASDHCRSHDLIGCQDIAWDLAGAQAEFDLTPAELDTLVLTVERHGSPEINRPLLEWITPAYLAFQLGLWSIASAATAEMEERQRIGRLLDRYRARLRTILLEDT